MEPGQGRRVKENQMLLYLFKNEIKCVSYFNWNEFFFISIINEIKKYSKIKKIKKNKKIGKLLKEMLRRKWLLFRNANRIIMAPGQWWRVKEML